MSKIGLTVITYSRPDYLKQCLQSLQLMNWGGADYKLVCADFKDTETRDKILQICKDYNVNCLSFPENVGVGRNKNAGLKQMIKDGCTDLFLIEDDILMRNPNTCKHYIQEAKRIGVQHMNFALHGPLNKGHKKTFGIATVYPHSVGAFSYYTKNVIEKVGLIDENFKNAWEHVHHTWRIANHNFTTPFWYFADHPQSALMLEEIPGSIDNSSIRPRNDWKQNIADGKAYWIKKHGFFLPPFPEGFY